MRSRKKLYAPNPYPNGFLNLHKLLNLLNKSAARRVIHNHPSGDPKPSRADIYITRELIDALQPFDITVHDHLIVGTTGVVSFRSAGLI